MTREKAEYIVNYSISLMALKKGYKRPTPEKIEKNIIDLMKKK